MIYNKYRERINIQCFVNKGFCYISSMSIACIFKTLASFTLHESLLIDIKNSRISYIPRWILAKKITIKHLYGCVTHVSFILETLVLDLSFQHRKPYNVQK